MSEIEALLSVDRGEVPPATYAFFERDTTAEDRLSHAILAATASIAAAMSTLAAVDLRVTALFVLIAAMLIVVATPTVNREPAPGSGGKRCVTVVTASGIIVRDARGLRTWRFDELAGVVSATFGPRPYIVLVERDGSRHALDYLSCQRGEALREVIGHRLRLQST